MRPLPRKSDPRRDTAADVVLIGYQDQGNLGRGYLAAFLRQQGYVVDMVDIRDGAESIASRLISSVVPLAVRTSESSAFQSSNPRESQTIADVQDGNADQQRDCDAGKAASDTLRFLRLAGSNICLLKRIYHGPVSRSEFGEAPRSGILVGAARLKPAISCAQGKRDTRLRHAPTVFHLFSASAWLISWTLHQVSGTCGFQPRVYPVYWL
jgi:hypothetical protein